MAVAPCLFTAGLQSWTECLCAPSLGILRHAVWWFGRLWSGQMWWGDGKAQLSHRVWCGGPAYRFQSSLGLDIPPPHLQVRTPTRLYKGPQVGGVGTSREVHAHFRGLTRGLFREGVVNSTASSRILHPELLELRRSSAWNATWCPFACCLRAPAPSWTAALETFSSQVGVRLWAVGHGR